MLFGTQRGGLLVAMNAGFDWRTFVDGHSKAVIMKVEALIANRYHDDEYEYRHVQLPKLMLKAIPKEYHDSAKGTLKLLWEEEWRAMGMTQVRGILFFSLSYRRSSRDLKEE